MGGARMKPVSYRSLKFPVAAPWILQFRANVRNMRKIPLLCFALAPLLIFAQNEYQFERLFTVYTPINGANECTFNDDGLCPIDALAGETFTLYNTSFTMGSGALLSVGEYGFLRIENAASLIILDGLFTFMEPIDSTSKVLYALNGVPGSHELVAEWRNWRLTNGPADNYVNFQLSLDQATGVAEVRFGPNSGGGVLYNNVNGPNCGIFHAPHSFSQCYGKLWAEGNGDAPTLDSLPNFSFDALVSLPSPNTLYRFTPHRCRVRSTRPMPRTHSLIRSGPNCSRCNSLIGTERNWSCWIPPDGSFDRWLPRTDKLRSR